VVEILNISNLTGLCNSQALNHEPLAGIIIQSFIRILESLTVQEVAADGCTCPTLSRQAVDYYYVFKRF